MTYIQPVSSLENYAELLSLCDEGSVVYLTENEQSKYVIQVVREYEKLKATIQLLAELSKGIESFRTEEEWTLEEAFEGLEN